MRCAICSKEIDVDIKFKDLFNFDYYCSNCKKDLDIKYSIIPNDDGYLFTYYYFTTKDEYIERINDKIFNSLNDILDDTIIFIDEENAKDALSINLKENIKLFSTKYINLENFFD